MTMRWSEVPAEALNLWLQDPVTKALVEDLQFQHYRALTEQSVNVGRGDIDAARLLVGRLAQLDEIIEKLAAKAQPMLASGGPYPSAVDEAAEPDEQWKDPGLNPYGDGQWTRMQLSR